MSGKKLKKWWWSYRIDRLLCSRKARLVVAGAKGNGFHLVKEQCTPKTLVFQDAYSYISWYF